MYDVGFVFPGKIEKVNSSFQVSAYSSASDQEMIDVYIKIFCQVIRLLFNERIRMSGMGAADEYNIHVKRGLLFFYFL
jgi:hypothetical protein